MAHSPGVAVIVCTRGRGGRVVETVRSILTGASPELELYIVDQNDDRRATSLLTEAVRDPRLHCLRSPHGLSVGRNTAAAATGAPLLAFTDDDCTVTPAWLSEVTAPFAGDRRIGLVFGSVLAAPHDRSAGFVPSYRRREPFVARSVFDKHRVEGIGASMAVRRSVWAALHGFDELLGAGARLRSAEETDFTIRALLAGHFVAETPGAAVIHHGFRSWEDGRDVIRGYLCGIGATLAKNVKCGHGSVLAVAGQLAVRWLVARPVVDLGRRSFRWTRLGGFATGVLTGLATPVDHATGHFRRPATPGAAGTGPRPTSAARSAAP
jgi:GT2 family glycosyltransferase